MLPRLAGQKAFKDSYFSSRHMFKRITAQAPPGTLQDGHLCSPPQLHTALLLLVRSLRRGCFNPCKFAQSLLQCKGDYH